MNWFLSVDQIDSPRTEWWSLTDLMRVSAAGLFFILPCTDSFIKVDMRTISFDIPPQEVRVSFAVTN